MIVCLNVLFTYVVIDLSGAHYNGCCLGKYSLCTQ